MAAVLEIVDVTTAYDKADVLQGVSLTVEAGSITCLLGSNGSGKTTLIRSILGLTPSRAGRVVFDGKETTRLPTHKVIAAGIACIPEGRKVFPKLTVEENLRVGLGVRAGSPPEIPEQVFDLFPVLQQMLRRRGGDLSGGQQQQLAIGRALVLQPTLLVLDEPTEGIQPNIVHEIGDIILKLNEEMGLTVLLVEQKLPFARRVASEFRILEKGRCVAGGAIAMLTDELVHAHLSV